jgi:hypothetical protein
MDIMAPIIIWLPFAHEADAQRAHLRELGRQASRAAFGVATAAWQSEHGASGWASAGIDHDAQGAPRIAGHRSAPFVSIVHTRGLAGCAIAAPGAPSIGIDAEPINASGIPALRSLAEETGEARLEHVGALKDDGKLNVVVRSHRDRVFAVVTAVVGEHVRAWTV